MSYTPPSGSEVAIDFGVGLPYTAPSGSEVGIDFAANPDILNPYADTALRATDFDVLASPGALEFIDTACSMIESDTSTSFLDLRVVDSQVLLSDRSQLSIYGIREFTNTAISFTETETIIGYSDHFVYDSKLSTADADLSTSWGTWDFWYTSLNATESDSITSWADHFAVYAQLLSTDGDVLKVTGLKEFIDTQLQATESTSINMFAGLFEQALSLGVRDQITFGMDTAKDQGYMEVTDKDSIKMTATEYVADSSLILTDKDVVDQWAYYDTVYTSLLLQDADSAIMGGESHVVDIALNLTDMNVALLGGFEDHPPVFTSTPVLTMAVGDTYSYTPVAIDDYSTPIITVIYAPAFLSFTGGILSGHTTYIYAGYHTIMIVATDDTGREVVQSYSLEVVSPFRTTDLIDSQDWLKSIEKKLVTLEFYGLELTSNTPRRLWYSDISYISKPTDVLPNKSFFPGIKDIPAFSRGIKTDLTGAESSWGEITLVNLGQLDPLLMEQTTRLRDITIKMGEIDWSYDDFKTVLQGVIADKGCYASTLNEVNLPIRSNAVLLSVPMTEEKFPDNDVLNPGKYKPQCYGGTTEFPIFNIKPVLIDAANLIYQYHIGRTGGSIEVRDLGVPVSYIDLPLEGKIQLLHPPAGDITADVVGAYTEDNHQYSTVAELVYHLVLDKTEVTTTMMDSSSFSILGKLFANVTVGFYLEEGGSSTVTEVCEWLLSSINSYFEFRRDGRMYVREFLEEGYLQKISDLPYDYVITEDDIGFDIGIDEVISAAPEISVGWRKNWYPQTSFADYVSQEQLEFKTRLEQPHTKLTKLNPDVTAKIVRPDPVETYETLILNESGANRVATSRASYRSKDRYVFDFDLYKIAPLLNTGDIVLIQTDRFGISDYPAIIVSIDDPIVTGTGKVKVLK